MELQVLPLAFILPSSLRSSQHFCFHIVKHTLSQAVQSLVQSHIFINQWMRGLSDFKVWDFSLNATCLPTQYVRRDEFLYPQHELIHFVQEETEVQGEVNHSVTLTELAMNVWPRESVKLGEG